jgi:hypothetical protein
MDYIVLSLWEQIVLAYLDVNTFSGMVVQCISHVSTEVSKMSLFKLSLSFSINFVVYECCW